MQVKAVMNRKMHLILSISMLAAFAAVSGGCGAAPNPARFESADCKNGLPSSLSNTVECGNLLVPENRSRRDSRLIQLHAAIIRSTNPAPAPDPVVYLSGGWADPALADIAHVLPGFEQVLVSRDLIVIDQRGVGYSEPSLDCPEIPAQLYQDAIAQASAPIRAKNYIEAARTCRDRLVGAGIDLSAYTTLANAADLEDLRLALGYDQWNLYGISYGTRLALAVMRHYPKGVRSVILDSSYPPDKNVFEDEAAILDRSLDLLAARCAADAACQRQYQEPTKVLWELADELDASPHNYLDGNALVGVVWGWMYRAEAIPWVPQWLHQMRSGRWANVPIQPAVMTQQSRAGALGLSEGKRFSVICAEEIPHTSAGEIAKARAGVPERLTAYFDEPVFDICGFWGARPADQEEYRPVVSDIPALILQGDYDPATPTEWGRATAESLGRGYYVEFPGIGHGVLGAGIDRGACAKAVVDAFLADPAQRPGSGCVNDMKPFFVTISN